MNIEKDSEQRNEADEERRVEICGSLKGHSAPFFAAYFGRYTAP